MKVLVLIAFLGVILQTYCARIDINLGELNGQHYVRRLGLTKRRSELPYFSATNMLGNSTETLDGKIHFAGSWAYALIEENITLPFVSFSGICVISHLRGGPANVYVLDPAAKTLSQTRIGPREKDFVVSIPTGSYVGIDLKRRKRKNSFALMSLTVSPGEDIRNAEKPKRKHILKKFPKEQRVIKKLYNL